MLGRRLLAGVHIGARGHLVVGVLVCVISPAVSWLDGSGQLAWTMFSRTGHYRLDLRAVGPDGRRRPIAPTSLARLAGPDGARVLAGADRMRHHDVARATLRRHLSDVARLACRVADAPRVEATLEERADLDAPIRRRTVGVRCDR